jgi:hypothetical protein
MEKIMAREVVIFSKSMLAAADLSSSQFLAITPDSSGKAALATDGAAAIGVLQNKPTSGNVAEVMVLGETKFQVGVGGVTSGDLVSATSTGAAQTADSGDYVLGWTMDTGAAGDFVTVVLSPQGKL